MTNSLAISKKTAVVFVGMLLAAMMFIGAAVPAHAAALTESQTQSILNLLSSFGADQATIDDVEAALKGEPTSGGGGVSSSVCPYAWSRDLTTGSTGDDVMKLQQYLNADPDTRLATSGVGSPGNETNYFGSLTAAGVTKLQDKYASDVLAPVGLSAGTGYFGPSTRAKINDLCSTATPADDDDTSGGGDTPTGDGVTIGAAAQPADSLAVESATRVPFTKFTLTAGASDVTLDSVVAERRGLAQDSNFDGVVLLDSDGLQIGVAKSLNANHQARIGEDYVLPAGTTETFTVAGNMGSSLNGGEVGRLAVVAINTDATVSGSLPIDDGAEHTMNTTLTIGSLSITAGSETNATKDIGTTGYTFGTFRVDAGSAEKVRLKSLRWNQTGSVGTGDLANVVTLVDGTEYPTTVSADGKFYTSIFGDGIVIDKGNSAELKIKGDMTDGSNRTVIFDVEKRADLHATGELYGYGILPDPGLGTTAADTTTTFTSGTPWFDGAKVTISKGSLTVAKDNSVNAQNVAENANGAPLGGFTIEAKGEPVSVGQMVFWFDPSGSGNASDLTNITLEKSDGTVIAGPEDAVIGGSVTFSNSVTFPVEKGSYVLKGKVGTDFANNDTIVASTTPSSDFTTVKGEDTNETITPSPSSAVTGNTMTVKAASIEVSVSPTPIAQSIVAGGAFTFANYKLDTTQSGDDVKLTSIPLAFDRASGSATNLTACALYDGGTQLTTGSNEVNPTTSASSTSFTFDSALVVPKGTIKTLDLTCNTSATSTGNEYRWGVDAHGDSTFSASGVDSGVSLTSGSGFTTIESAGQKITVDTSGSFTVVDDSTLGYRVVSPGEEVELLKLKYTATKEAVNVKRVALELKGTASNTPLNLVGNEATLWDGSTQVGTATFGTAGANTDKATSTLTSDFIATEDGSTLTVKGTISGISHTQGPMTRSGDLLKVAYDGDNSNGTTNGNYGVGVSSGTTITPSSSDVTPTGVRIMAAYPTFNYIAPSDTTLNSGTTANKQLYRFSVKANNGDVHLYKTTFSVSSTSAPGGQTGATTSLFSLYAYTDSGFNSPDTVFSSDGLLNSGQCFNGKKSTAAGAVNGTTKPLEIFMDKGIGGGASADCNNATTTYEIPSGATRYFQLEATVANVEVGGSSAESFTVQLMGDAAYHANSSNLMDQASGIDGDTNDDLIWSPNSTSTTVKITDLDYTNGYVIPGLGSIGASTNTFTSS